MCLTGCTPEWCLECENCYTPARQPWIRWAVVWAFQPLGLYRNRSCLVILQVLCNQPAIVASFLIGRLDLLHEQRSKETSMLPNLEDVNHTECPMFCQNRYLLESVVRKLVAVYFIFLFNAVLLTSSIAVGTWLARTESTRGMTVITQRRGEWLHTWRPENSASKI